MDDRELDAQLGRLDPVRAQVCVLDRESLNDLLDDIVATPRIRPAQRHNDAMPVERRVRRPARTLVTVAAASVVTMGVVGFAVTQGSDGDTVPATSPTTLPVARSVLDDLPLLVLPGDGWVMTRLDQDPRGNPAEMNFLAAADATSGTTDIVNEATNAAGDLTAYDVDYGTSLDIVWYDYDRTGDFDREFESRGPVEVLGRSATAFVSGDFFVVVVPLPHGSLQVTASVGTIEQLREVLASVHAVDRATFETELPESVVRPDARDAAIQQMSLGIPRIGTADLSLALERNGYSDRYQLGVAVAGGYACAWFDLWFSASERGDGAEADRAASALRSSETWPVLVEMSATGGYPNELWAYVAGIDGAAVPGGLTRETVTSGLGCGWEDPDAPPITQAATG